VKVAIEGLGGFFLVFFCQNGYIVERGKSMEAVQTATPPSFESVWALIQENAKQHERDMKEIRESQKELVESQKEYEQERKKDKAEFNEKLGNYINLFGDFTEYMMAPKLREKFKDFGLFFPKTSRNVRVKDENNKTILEADAMLENGDKAMMVEIKTQLTVERINKHIERLEKMRKHADLYGDKRTFLGAVAGVVVDDESREYALNQGFYLIEPEGEELIITPPNNKPKEW
jgi:hypothetical protein